MFSTLRRRIARAAGPLHAFTLDVDRVAETQRHRHGVRKTLGLLGDSSLWALALMRGAASMRAGIGTSLGLSTVLRIGFHIDAWSDDIAGGLRLPHPFNIVVGEGVRIGPGCTLMHNVTIQRGSGTELANGVVLGTGSVVLSGARIGPHSMIGAVSVVRGAIPADSVAVGAPARVTRALRAEERSTWQSA